MTRKIFLSSSHSPTYVVVLKWSATCFSFVLLTFVYFRSATYRAGLAASFGAMFGWHGLTLFAYQARRRVWRPSVARRFFQPPSSLPELGRLHIFFIGFLSPWVLFCVPNTFVPLKRLAPAVEQIPRLLPIQSPSHLVGGGRLWWIVLFFTLKSFFTARPRLSSLYFQFKAASLSVAFVTPSFNQRRYSGGVYRFRAGAESSLLVPGRRRGRRVDADGSAEWSNRSATLLWSGVFKKKTPTS